MYFVIVEWSKYSEVRCAFKYSHKCKFLIMTILGHLAVSWWLLLLWPLLYVWDRGKHNACIPVVAIVMEKNCSCDCRLGEKDWGNFSPGDLVNINCEEESSCSHSLIVLNFLYKSQKSLYWDKLWLIVTVSNWILKAGWNVS